jgi:hypothetical protein
LVLLTQGIIFIGWLGPSIQSILEARAAATQVFSLIDQVASLNALLIFFSDLGKKHR